MNKVKARIYQEEKGEEKFKVSNKKTVELISQKPYKPIHLRVDEIIAHR